MARVNHPYETRIRERERERRKMTQPLGISFPLSFLLPLDWHANLFRLTRRTDDATARPSAGITRVINPKEAVFSNSNVNRSPDLPEEFIRISYFIILTFHYIIK